MSITGAGVDLFWLPLGAGGHVVRFNGRAFEALVARRQHRAPQPLFHSALQVTLDGHGWVIEMTPVWGNREPERGVVSEGPVGSRLLGRSRLFRYEIRRWRDGVIPDLAEAVGGAQRVSDGPVLARRLLDLVPQAPTLTWGRDELVLGDMWNSTSLVAWLLVMSGHDLAGVQPPDGGRAPGWQAGQVTALRTAYSGRTCSPPSSTATSASTASSTSTWET